MQTSFNAWKAAVRRQYPEATFEGNKDICQAFHRQSKSKIIGVGEWDGAVGEVYPKNEGEFELNWINPDSVLDLEPLVGVISRKWESYARTEALENCMESECKGCDVCSSLLVGV